MSTQAAPNPTPQQSPAATYTVAEVAALLRCSAKHVRRLTVTGTIPGHFKFGRLVRYSRGAIDRWLAEGGAASSQRATGGSSHAT
jgi:excisionase family DNA binding protein